MSGDPVGVSIDLAHAFAGRLGVDVEWVVFDAAGKLVPNASPIHANDEVDQPGHRVTVGKVWMWPLASSSSWRQMPGAFQI
ncbi:MAG: hypothetical protein RIS34_2048 [Pseudomonadota bacterium]